MDYSIQTNFLTFSLGSIIHGHASIYSEQQLLWKFPLFDKSKLVIITLRNEICSESSGLHFAERETHGLLGRNGLLVLK